jgi:hypothetical protein
MPQVHTTKSTLECPIENQSKTQNKTRKHTQVNDTWCMRKVAEPKRKQNTKQNSPQCADASQIHDHWNGLCRSKAKQKTKQ